MLDNYIGLSSIYKYHGSILKLTGAFLLTLIKTTNFFRVYLFLLGYLFNLIAIKILHIF